MSDIDFSKTHMNNWLSQQNQPRARKTGPTAFIAMEFLAAVVYAGYSLCQHSLASAAGARLLP